MQAPVSKILESGEKVTLPGWVLPSLASAAFTVIVTVIGAGVTVWNTSSLHEATLSSHSKIIDQLVTQMGQARGDVTRLETKVARLEQEQGHFQELAIDKIDTLLERDRFRKPR